MGGIYHLNIDTADNDQTKWGMKMIEQCFKDVLTNFMTKNMVVCNAMMAVRQKLLQITFSWLERHKNLYSTEHKHYL